MDLMGGVSLLFQYIHVGNVKVGRRGSGIGFWGISLDQGETHLSFKRGFLSALEDGERLSLGDFLRPYLLGAFVLGVMERKGPFYLTSYGEGGEFSQVLTQADPFPYLRWANRHLEVPQRLHIRDTGGTIFVDLYSMPRPGFFAGFELGKRVFYIGAGGEEVEDFLHGGWDRPEEVGVCWPDGKLGRFRSLEEAASHLGRFTVRS